MFGFGRPMPLAVVPLWPLKRKFGERSGHRESNARDRGAATHSACKYPALTSVWHGAQPIVSSDLDGPIAILQCKPFGSEAIMAEFRAVCL